MANENPKLTITLTGRPPVKITKADWPIVASADDQDHNGEIEARASRKASWSIKVRQHTDGRAIVYSVHDYESQWRGESSRDVRGGELLDAGADIPAAIQRVGEEIEARLPDQGAFGTGVFPRLVHECIADLPAVEL